MRIPVLGRAMINAYLVDDGKGSLTLIDTGPGRSVGRIEKGLRAYGAELGDIERIVVTHAHPERHADRRRRAVQPPRGGTGPWLPMLRSCPRHRSAERLSDVEFESVVFGHGREIHGRAAVDAYIDEG